MKIEARCFAVAIQHFPNEEPVNSSTPRTTNIIDPKTTIDHTVLPRFGL